MNYAASWLGALHESSAAAEMRESIWLFPLVETIHILGFTVLVGAVVMFDLRVLGVTKRLPVRGLAQHLLPWSLAGLLLIVPTGTLMFISDAVVLADNPAFQVKMLLLALAMTNAVAFHLGSFRSARLWNQDTAAPIGARIQALASIVIWIAVIACGRAIAYV